MLVNIGDTTYKQIVDEGSSIKTHLKVESISEYDLIGNIVKYKAIDDYGGWAEFEDEKESSGNLEEERFLHEYEFYADGRLKRHITYKKL